MQTASEVPQEVDIPLLSVLIVNYNAGELLVRSVESALKSSLSLEVIVSDNGSVDNSMALLQAGYGNDPRLKILRNGANLGFAAGHNRALHLARAPFLLFLNPDCIIGEQTLPRLLDFMHSTPRAGMVGCLVLNPDGNEQKASRRRIPDPWIGLVHFLHLDRFGHRFLASKRLDLDPEPLPESPVTVEAISGSFMLVRRQALNEVGPLDEGYFLHCEDLDWFVRFHRAGWLIYFVPGVDVYHYQGACSKSRPITVEWHKHKGMTRFFRKFQFQNYPLPFSLLVIAGIWLHFGYCAAGEGMRRLWRIRNHAGV